jgi:hypothetical protein
MVIFHFPMIVKENLILKNVFFWKYIQSILFCQKNYVKVLIFQKKKSIFW